MPHKHSGNQLKSIMVRQMRLNIKIDNYRHLYTKESEKSLGLDIDCKLNYKCRITTEIKKNKPIMANGNKFQTMSEKLYTIACL